MSRGPGDHWEKLQIILQNRGARPRINFGGGGLPGGRGGLGALGSLIVLGIGGWAISDSLFNGERLGCFYEALQYHGWFADTVEQSTVVTVLSNTRG